MNEYVSYSELDEYQSLDASATAELARLRRFCESASRMWDGTCRRVFYPRLETRYYDMPTDVTRLVLDDDLLEVVTFTTQNGGEAVLPADYYLMCGRLYGQTPYDRIVMKTDGNRPNLLFTGTLQRAQIVAGYWGYHETWADAWENSQDDVKDATGITAGATSITVADADGADRFGLTPRFRVQQLLKIESEYLYVTAINTTSNALTVVRGMNGTTAATHAKDMDIFVYKPMGEVWHAVRRLAAWLYAQRDAPFTKIEVMPGGGRQLTIPDTAPRDILGVASRYMRGR